MLVAVPALESTHWIEFTRFDASGGEIDAGRIDFAAHVPGEGGNGGPGGPTTRARAPAYDAADAEHATVVDNGLPADRFDLLILGDGYLDTNADRDAFRADVQAALDTLWKYPTYYQLRSAMNVHVAFVPSNESGAGSGATSLKDTPFEAYYNCFGTGHLICLGETGAAFAETVALDAPGNYGQGSQDAIAVLTSDSDYGGSGGLILVFSSNADSTEILAHEFGHTVINLADEYEAEVEPAALYEAWAKTTANVSGSVSVPGDLKWSALVDSSTAIPTETDPGGCVRNDTCSDSTLPAGTVGMYEGAGYTACGSFRPTTECLMRCLDRVLCPVCRDAFLATLENSIPVVDVYVRDNALDIGNPPSPVNVEHPVGSGALVKPWHSVDIRVDAPPFGDPAVPGPHENPMAGETNHVFVTVHNRGSDPTPMVVQVELFHAGASGGAPPFPGSWTSLGTQNASVAGQEGSDTVVFDWFVPTGTPSHVCTLAVIDTPPDPAPVPGASLSEFVRNSNNVTWKNLHVSHVSAISGDLFNYGEQQTIVFRVEVAGIPGSTRLLLEVDPGIVLDEFDASHPSQMTLVARVGNEFEILRDEKEQKWFALQTTLPSGESRTPFLAPFTLDVKPPGGTSPGTTFQVTVNQYEVDPTSGILGNVIGGNTYTMTVE